MWDLRSAHLAGDPVLHEIANDPDTGTKKLQPGSPLDSVMRLQQALVDLDWTHRVEPPVLDPASFVIGVYGPVTTKTVLKYKTHYDLRYPPDDPLGFIDGLAGPRTLRLLDLHCLLLEEATVGLAQKAAEVEARTGEQFRDRAVAIIGTRGASTERTGGGTPALPSGLWWHKVLGAAYVRMPFFDHYLRTGDVQHPPELGPLGFPVGDDYEVADGVVRQDFERAYLLWDSQQAQMTTYPEDHGGDVSGGPSF
jgi:hypothetical protein